MDSNHRIHESESCALPTWRTGRKNMIGTPIVAHLRLIDQPLLRVSSLLIRIAAYKRSVNGFSLTLSAVVIAADPSPCDGEHQVLRLVTSRDWHDLTEQFAQELDRCSDHQSRELRFKLCCSALALSSSVKAISSCSTLHLFVGIKL